MYTPIADDEISSISGYLDQQLGALRASIVGLTDEQARLRPCRSALSLGGLLKHVTYGMRGATKRLTDAVPAATSIDQAAYAAYMGSFALTDDETAEAILADFDAVRIEYVTAVRATDPDAPTVEPPSPWFGIHDARAANARYYLLHQIEEMARHAGHADIIREQIDGMSIAAIQLTADGMPANQFFQPYVPTPGTLGA